MPSACNLHPKFGYPSSSPTLHRRAKFALSFVVFGSIAAASGAVLQVANLTPATNEIKNNNSDPRLPRSMPATGPRPAPSRWLFPPRPIFLAVQIPFPLPPRARLC